MIKFKIRNPNYEKEVLREVNAIDFDDYTYYVSQQLNNGYKFKHALFDKKTGLMVCCGKTKKELFDTYNNLSVRYSKIRNDVIYKNYIQQYEQLKKEVSV